MLTSRESGEPDGGPALRPATPMTSIQQYESPDAAEAQFMAEQRAADQRSSEPTRTQHRPSPDRPTDDPPVHDPEQEPGQDPSVRDRSGQAGGEGRPARGTARVRPAAPSGAGASGAAAADIQTTSGVPKVVIPTAAGSAPVPAGPAPDDHAPDDHTRDDRTRDDAPEDHTPEDDAPEEHASEVASAEVAVEEPETRGAGESDAVLPVGAEQLPEAAEPTPLQSDTADDAAEPGAGVEPDVEPDAEARVEADVEAELVPETGAVAAPEAEAAFKPAAMTDPAPETTIKAGAAAEAATTDPAPPPASGPEAAAGPEVGATAGTTAEVSLEPAAEPAEAEPATTEPATAGDLEDLGPTSETDIEQVRDDNADLGPQAEAEVESRSALNPQPEVEAETGAETPAAPEAAPEETPGSAPQETAAQSAAPVTTDPDATSVLILPAPETPETPEQPETAEPPETAEQPETSETPEGSETPDTSDAAPDDAAAADDDPAEDSPGIADTVVLQLEPAPEDTVVLVLPESPRNAAEDTAILVRAHDDTVVIPAVTATVSPPTDVVTAVIPVVPGRPGDQRTPAASPPDPARRPRPARARREPLDLGHAPAVLTISALGVLMVALGYAGGRVSTGNASFAYWVGQVVVFTPVVVRLLSRRMAGVAESFLLVMGLALHQYLLKWMYSPDQFRFPDELQHWLATTIIVQSGELFRPNPALPPAEHFPGLAELGAAVAQMTGLPVTAAGVIVAGVAHLVFVGVLFAVVLRASNSPAVAGVACATYATAMHYLFFNSMFLYQTAALPFFMLTIWAVRRWRAEGGRIFAVLAVTSMALTTVSHHVTALALVATLVLLAVAELAVDRPRRWSALAMPASGAVVVAAWILLVATDVLGYLEAPVDQVVRTVSQLFSGESDPASTTAPVALGQLVVQGAGLLGLLVLYLAVTRDMVQRRDRDWWRWAAVAGGTIFFAGNGVRFLGQNGPEIAGRLSTFTYIPISILAAIGLVRGVQLIPARDADGHRWRAAAPAIDVVMPGGWNLYSRVAAGSAMITLLMLGARAGGWPPIASILPGPYLAGGYERSVDAYGLAAANWQRTALGPGNRVGGDATSISLASTYGRQDPVREVGELYYADTWGLEQDNLVQTTHVQYLVVDRRLGTQLPESGAYFEGDPRSGQITSPLTAGQLGKFDTLADVDRLYDNGTVRIYRTALQ